MNWIRRDRETGEETPLTAEHAARKLSGYYRDLPAAMSAASRDMPLTTGAADYYPEEKER